MRKFILDSSYVAPMVRSLCDFGSFAPVVADGAAPAIDESGSSTVTEGVSDVISVFAAQRRQLEES